MKKSRNQMEKTKNISSVKAIPKSEIDPEIQFLDYNFIEDFNKVLSKGDLIEIDRKTHKHWAFCVKVEAHNILCFHVTKIPNFEADNSKYKKFKKLACIRCESLRDILCIAGSTFSKFRVNNQEEKAKEIMKSKKISITPTFENIIIYLESLVNYVDYHPEDKNCEHFVTEWKYGIGFSSHSNKYHKLINTGFGVTGAFGASAFGASAGLTAAGFTTAGIAGGSIAAGVQSSIGAVAAGSTFATLQSLGATGVIATVGMGAGLALLPIAAGAIAYNVIKYKERSKLCNEYGIQI